MPAKVKVICRLCGERVCYTKARLKKGKCPSCDVDIDEHARDVIRENLSVQHMQAAFGNPRLKWPWMTL